MQALSILKQFLKQHPGASIFNECLRHILKSRNMVSKKYLKDIQGPKNVYVEKIVMIFQGPSNVYF